MRILLPEHFPVICIPCDVFNSWNFPTMRFIAGTLNFGRGISHVGHILNDILYGFSRHGAGLTHPRAALPSGAPPSTRCSFRSVLGALSALHCGAKSERALHNLRCSLVVFPPQACLWCWMSARAKVNIVSFFRESNLSLHHFCLGQCK